jgi:predicted esterase
MKDVDDVGDPNVLGWSPDDGTFAYRWNVALCFVGTNGTTCPGEIPTPDLDSFVWLSPASCAYIDADTNHDNVPQIAVAQNIHGTWQETTSWPLPTAKGKPHSLLAMGTNTVAWQAGNAIWQMNLASGKIESVYANPEGSIDSVSYSEESGKFLILETAKASSRRRLPALFALLNGSKIPETSSKLSMRDTRLINQGRGYVFLHPEGENMSLIIQPGGGEAEETFFQSGRVEDFFCDGESSRVYALASKTNEAPSIWLCDAAAGNAQCLYSPWGFAAVPLHFQTASVHYVELPGKHHEKFVLIPPANFSPDKKYPLIIGMQSYDWMNVPHATYSQALANSGDYVALTDYHYTHQTEEALLHYTNNVLAVYNDLLKNPNVDRSQVYLFAFSSSTIVVNHLIDDYPGRWRGVMLFNPTADLPMPKSGGFPPILATAGSDEEWLYKQFPSYQETLAKEGLSMEWYVHPDEGHIERSQNVMYKRALLMENMVLGN